MSIDFRKVTVWLAAGVLVVSVSACSPTPDAERVSSGPASTVTPTPEDTATPVSGEITPEKEAEMVAALENAGAGLEVDLISLVDEASSAPILFYSSAEQDYIHINFDSDSLPVEKVKSWFESQEWSDEWIDYVPSTVDNIWGFSDSSFGKESAAGFVVAQTEDADTTSLTILLN